MPAAKSASPATPSPRKNDLLVTEVRQRHRMLANSSSWPDIYDLDLFVLAIPKEVEVFGSVALDERILVAFQLKESFGVSVAVVERHG